jgi:amino acid permease
MSTAGSSAGTGSGEKHAAGAFDVRNVIAALIGFYGLVLVVVGLVDNGDEALEKTDGFNANLWVGLGMIVFALSFTLWSRLRPIVVEARHEDEDAPPRH